MSGESLGATPRATEARNSCRFCCTKQAARMMRRRGVRRYGLFTFWARSSVTISRSVCKHARAHTHTHTHTHTHALIPLFAWLRGRRQSSKEPATHRGIPVQGGLPSAVCVCVCVCVSEMGSAR